MTKIKHTVLKKIKSGQIKMKARWKFDVERSSIYGLLTVSILALGIILNGVVYTTLLKNPMELWEYGEVGRVIFWSGLPYWWMLGIGLLVASLIGATTRTGENYKRGLKKVSLLTGLLIMAASIAAFLVLKQFELEVLLWFT
ncbi:MAG: hypothetical protein ACOX6N_02725 [Patescibacteria group bacterium]